MRVLQLISSGGMYGAEAVILNLASCLDARGHGSVLGVFANTNGGDVQLHREAQVRQLESHLLPCVGQFDRRTMAQIRQLVRERSIDVVHAHGYKADFYAYFALRGGRVPMVSTCHNWLDTDMRVRLYGRMDRFLLRRFNAVAVVSEVLFNSLRRCDFEMSKVHLIENGVDVAPFRGAAMRVAKSTRSNDSIQIGLVGRLSPEKGVDLYLQAASLLLQDEPQVRFAIAGDGPERTRLEELAADLGIAHKVEFLGRSDAMPELLASFDILVSASRFEGLPMTILEGMASGRSIVATQVGEVPKVLNRGEAGMLIPPENVPALANAILTLIRDPKLRQTYAQRSLERVTELYSADQMTSRYLAMYATA